jgi:ribonuclease BN (tRNA processing enzyme)
MGVTLTVLGCTGSYPGPEGACSGYLLRSDDQAVVFDLGPGTMAALQRHMDLGELTAVVLSHHHPDHWTDLGVLRTAWRYGLGRAGLTVVGTAQGRDLADRLADGHLAPTIDWIDVDDGDEVKLGTWNLTFSATDHYVPTLAVRVDLQGRSFAYSADTGPGWSPEALGDDLDVLLCEATMLDEERTGDRAELLHLTATEAGRLARKVGVERLLVTHLPVGADPAAYRAEAGEAFGGPVEVVHQDAVYDL